MSSERLLAEIVSIRKNYNRVVFELEKSKENIKLLVAENEKLKEEKEKNCSNLDLMNSST